MEKKFLYHGSSVNYTVEGEGTPIVLLHGFGEDSSIWDAQKDFLKRYYRLIIPDLPGSGRSEMLHIRDVQIEAYAEVVKELLEQEQVAECILLGHSMGGYITLAFAEKYPVMLNGFGLIHSTAFADSEEKKANRLQGINMLKEHTAFSFLKNTIPNLFAKDFKNTQRDTVSALIEKSRSFKAEALTQYLAAMMNRPDRTKVLANAKVPVLFVIGTEDTAAPLTDLLKQVDLPKISHIHIIENVAHMSMLEAPEILNNYLLKFIQSIGQ
jgi:pimeloyl-ACP methyl ester carboxylesterase